MAEKGHDVIVIGSGFGGSVMAARLAEHGLRVLLLERGLWRGPAATDEPPRPRRGFPRGLTGLLRDVRSIRFARGARSRELMLNPRGLFEVHGLGGVRTLTLSAVGGGSLPYLLLVAPEDEFFDSYPDEITGAEMAPYFERVRSVLRPGRLPELPEKSALFERVAAEAGFGEVVYPDLGIVFGDGPGRPQTVRNAAGVEQGTCTYLGECILGCPRRAKTSMDLTYVPLALRHGADLRVLSEVTGIERRDGGYRVVYWDHEARRERDATAPRVVLAAGALNTVRLLFTARDRHGTLPEISPALGRGFSANGDAFALVWRTARLARSDSGPNGGAYAVERDGERRQRYVLVEGGLPLGAIRLPEALRRRLGSSLSINTIGRDGAAAELELRGKGLALRQERPLGRAFYDEANAVLRRVGQHYRASKTLVGEGRVFTAHPMGGAAIADTPERAVIDHRGEVFGCPGLHVADGAAFPAPPGLPPSLTIAALAERQADLLVAGSGG